MQFEELEKRYGTKEAAFLELEIARFWAIDDNNERFEYADNFRLARKGVRDDEARYEDIRREGCCGYFDTELGPSHGGHVYLYGFNYGH